VEVLLQFLDADGRESEMTVSIGSGSFIELPQTGERAPEPCTGQVRQKYFDDFRKKDLHFFSGDHKEYHEWAANPWLIIGVFRCA